MVVVLVLLGCIPGFADDRSGSKSRSSSDKKGIRSNILRRSRCIGAHTKGGR